MPRWPEKRAPKRIQAAQPPPSRHHHDYHPHDSKQHNYWVELVRVCRLAVVAAAAACCSYCDNENPPPPNEVRAIRREGRRAISTQLAGRVWYVHHVISHHVSFGRELSHLFQRIELISTPSIALDTIVRIILFSRRGSHCTSARGGVAGEGTSWDKKTQKFRLLPATLIKNTFFASLGNILLLFFQAPLLKNCSKYWAGMRCYSYP